MSDGSREFIVDENALESSGALLSGARTRISPVSSSDKHVSTAGELARLRELGLLDERSRINPEIEHSLRVLAGARGEVIVEVVGPPGLFRARVYYAADLGAPVALLTADKGIAVRDPAPVQDILQLLDEVTGRSQVRACKFEAELDAEEALVLAAMCDAHRITALRSLAEGDHSVPQPVGAADIRAALVGVSGDERRWMARAVGRLMLSPTDLAEERVKNALSGLITGGHVTQRSEGLYCLDGPARAVADAMLVMDSEVSVATIKEEDDDTIRQTVCTCLQSDAHHLLLIQSIGDVLRLQMVTAADVTEYASVVFDQMADQVASPNLSRS